MTRRNLFLLPSLLLGVAACNVSTDANNDQTVLSVDHDAIENGVAKAGNLAEQAVEKTGQAIDRAAPVVENSAREIGQETERAVDKAGNAIERVDVDVNVRDANTQDGR